MATMKGSKKEGKKQKIWLSDDLISWTVSSGTHPVRMTGKIKALKNICDTKVISILSKKQ